MGCHFRLLGNLPDPGMEPGSPALQADALPSEPPGKPIISIDKPSNMSLITFETFLVLESYYQHIKEVVGLFYILFNFLN